MTVDSLIFDLDGTLWDTTEPCAEAWNAALHEARIPYRPITPADIAGIMGLQHHQIFPKVFPDLTPDDHQRLAPLCYSFEEEVIQCLGGRLYPGVQETVPRLAGRWPLFIVSNCQRGYIELFLAMQGWRQHFRDFECHGNTGLSKADNLRRVIERNNLRHPLYLGDTPGDEEAARLAGVPFFFCDYGFGRCENYLQRLSAFHELELMLRSWAPPSPA